MVSEKMLALGTARSCIRELFEYGLRQAAAVGKENVYDYSLGNPSIPAPAKVNETFISVVRDTDSLAVHGYTPATGGMEARKAVAEDLNRRFGTAIRGENIFFTCGAAPALVSVVRALAVEGAEILAIAPFFPEYRPFVENSGASFRVVPADTETFQISLEALEASLTPHTQAIIINSPNNPSGAVYTRQTLEKVGTLLTRKGREYGHPIYIIADEPYRELVYDGVEVPFIPTVYDNTIVCYSYSKSLSLPGERLGYVLVPDEAEDARLVYAAIAGAGRSLGYVCAPSMFQHICAACADETSDISVYETNKNLLLKSLREMGYHVVEPGGTFYMFPRTLEADDVAFCERAKNHNLLIVPGAGFGCPGHTRISFCVPTERIERSLAAFEALAKEYR